MAPSRREASQHVPFWHIVATLPHSGCYASECQPRRCKPQVNDLHVVPELLHGLEALDVRETAQRALECEVHATFDKTIDLLKHQSRRNDGGEFGSQRRQPARNEIRVDEVQYMGIVGQVFPGERRLPAPFGPAISRQRGRCSFRFLILATQTFLCGATEVPSLRPRTNSPFFGEIAAAVERS